MLTHAPPSYVSISSALGIIGRNTDTGTDQWRNSSFPQF
jgi:hypothetical protein